MTKKWTQIIWYLYKTYLQNWLKSLGNLTWKLTITKLCIKLCIRHENQLSFHYEKFNHNSLIKAKPEQPGPLDCNIFSQQVLWLFAFYGPVQWPVKEPSFSSRVSISISISVSVSISGQLPENSPGNHQPEECVHGHGELIRKLNRFNYCTSNGQWKSAGGSDRRTGEEGAPPHQRMVRSCSSYCADGGYSAIRLLVFYEKWL